MLPSCSGKFLDLKEYQFHKLQEERWYESQNGWRTSGGSISVDLLYHYLEIKFRKNLRSWISTDFHLRQEEIFKIIGNLKGRKKYEQKKATKLGFSSL